MKDQVEHLRKDSLERLSQTPDEGALETLRHEILGRKGRLTLLLKGLKNLSEDEKRTVGKMANTLRDELEVQFKVRFQELQESKLGRIGKDAFDSTLPGVVQELGRLHPITRFIEEIEDTFTALNFDIADGPEMEDDYHNFTALNIGPDHPARDTQDTFWAKDIPYLLRTQTSSVQIRHMEKIQPPIRVVSPGRVFRRDDMDATHSPMFHQFEGLMIDRDINLTHLKGILTVALRRLIHPKLELRFRGSYFPFVEPGMEVDVTCVLCQGSGETSGPKQGCSICKQSGWIEMLGCGMVHPEVLRAVHIDPKNYQGFAFGAGIERLLMIKYKINDIRLFYENDPRFLGQFA